MQYEKQLIVIKNGKEVGYTYYVKKNMDSEFECDMYNVGIKTKGNKKEISDFSPSLKEAILLCNYLYEENVSPDNIFLMGEEFLTKAGI